MAANGGALAPIRKAEGGVHIDRHPGEEALHHLPGRAE